MSLPQHAMIATLRRLCEADTRLEAAMLYGSFAYNEADEFSDIDVLLYFADDYLLDIDQTAWIEQIQPVALSYINEFGIRAIVFDNLVRGEFHFDPASHLANFENFRGQWWFPSSAILFDRSGRLAQYLQAVSEKPQRDTLETRDHLCHEFLNRFVFAMNVLARGELARAVELTVWQNDILLHMARLEENQTDHWFTPTRALEHDLSPAAYARFVQCTAPLDKLALWSAYRNAWQWGKAWIQMYSTAYDALVDKIDQRLAELYHQASS
ncbi:MAG: aminoglycoside 6-adenylyltransferase [Anaerolineae bacterium]